MILIVVHFLVIVRLLMYLHYGNNASGGFIKLLRSLPYKYIPDVYVPVVYCLYLRFIILCNVYDWNLTLSCFLSVL